MLVLILGIISYKVLWDDMEKNINGFESEHKLWLSLFRPGKQERRAKNGLVGKIGLFPSVPGCDTVNQIELVFSQREKRLRSWLDRDLSLLHFRLEMRRKAKKKRTDYATEDRGERMTTKYV
jgi:hypothetical protein